MRSASKYIAAALLLAANFFLSSAFPQRPEPQRLVNDFAGLMTGGQAANLEQILVEFDDSTSNQITVVTVEDLEGYASADFATRIGLDWKVGRGEFNNGIVLLVKPKTEDSSGEVAISVGYGLEGAIPDVYCKRIIDNEMIPHFREDDYASGIFAACDVLMKLASGEISEPRESDEETPAAVFFVLLAAFICFMIVIAIISKGGGNNGGGGSGGKDDGDIIAKSIILGNILGSGHGGHFGGSGGFGGGSFGGSGGFGGFGGGSFGGGGASGKW